MASKPGKDSREWAHERLSRKDQPKRGDRERSVSNVSVRSKSQGRTREQFEKLHTQNCQDYRDRQFCLKGTRCQRNHQYELWPTLVNYSRILDGIIGQNHTTWEIVRQLGKRVDSLDKKLDAILDHLKISVPAGDEEEDMAVVMSRKIVACGSQVRARSKSAGPSPRSGYYIPAVAAGIPLPHYNPLISQSASGYNPTGAGVMMTQPQHSPYPPVVTAPTSLP